MACLVLRRNYCRSVEEEDSKKTVMSTVLPMMSMSSRTTEESLSVVRDGLFLSLLVVNPTLLSNPLQQALLNELKALCGFSEFALH